METVHCTHCAALVPINPDRAGIDDCCTTLALIYDPIPAPQPDAAGQFDFAALVAADPNMPDAWRLRWLAICLSERLEDLRGAVLPDPAANTLLAGVLLAAIRRFTPEGELTQPPHELAAPVVPTVLLPDDPQQPRLEQLRRLALLIADACNDPDSGLNDGGAAWLIGNLRGTLGRVDHARAQRAARRQGGQS